MSTARPDERLVLPNLVRALAAEQPDAIFLQEVGGRALTYAEVYEAARGLAASLRRRGIQSGDRVATFFPTGADGVVIWLACAYAAAINVPISTGYVGHMLEHAIDLTKPVLILADAQLVEPLAEQSVRAGTLGEPREGQRAAGDDPAPATWTGCPSLMFTSGTTGPSKAVTMRWLQLYRMATNTCKTDFAAPGDRVYVPWPLNHISGTGSVYAAAISAGTAVLREKWSTSSFMADIYEHRCTFTLLMLEMTRYVMTMDLPEGLGECPLERVYAVPTNPDLAPLMAKLGARYCTSYNSTELSTLIVNPGMDAVPLGAAGKPRAGAQIRIVDADGDEVAPGEVGELLIRSQDPAEVFAGYWDMPEATQEAWRDGWFHTQDAVR